MSIGPAGEILRLLGRPRGAPAAAGRRRAARGPRRVPARGRLGLGPGLDLDRHRHGAREGRLTKDSVGSRTAASRSSAAARARRSCSCTGPWPTAATGGRSSTALAGRLHRGGLGRARLRRLLRPARRLRARGLRGLPRALHRARSASSGRTSWASPSAPASPSSCSAAIPAVPRSLVLAPPMRVGGLAGTRGRGAAPRDGLLGDADLPPERVVTRLQQPRSSRTRSRPSRGRVHVALMRDFRPAGVRAMANALADADLREVLPRIDVPDPAGARRRGQALPADDRRGAPRADPRARSSSCSRGRATWSTSRRPSASTTRCGAS